MLAMPRVSYASDPSTLLTAEALFEEGRKLADAGKYEAAQEKFEASEKLESAPGTLLHLANCREKLGHTASAWITFKRASLAARAVKRTDWVDLADERAKDLEPMLARLTLGFERTSDAASVEIRRDGARVETAEVGTPIPVDPGRHVIEVRAPGKTTWTKAVDVAASARVTVLVPTVDTFADDKPLDVVVPPSPPSSEPATTSATSPLLTVGWVTGGAGALGLGMGAVAGLVAVSKDSESKGICPTTACGDAAAIRANDAAKGWSTVSTIAFVGGAVLATTGIVLVVVAPKSATRTAGTRSHLAFGGPGLVWSGEFR